MDSFPFIEFGCCWDLVDLLMLILLANIDLFTYLIRISVSHMPERRAQRTRDLSITERGSVRGSEIW